MRIGVLDVDNQGKIGNCFPNLPLMKISAWHKAQGDTVEWVEPLGGHYDKAYVSKVFSFTPDYEYFIDADEVQYGGSGYCISLSLSLLVKKFITKTLINLFHMRLSI